MADPFIAEIVMFGGNFAPRGWALCDGQLLQISQYSALFSLLGTTYGGDGRVTFGLPDLRGRSPMHAGSGPGLTGRSLGQKIGSEVVTLTTTQIPSHTHGVSCYNQPGTSDTAVGNFPAANENEALYHNVGNAAMAAGMVGNQGGGQAHNNMHPVQVVNFIIALQGIFPSRN